LNNTVSLYYLKIVLDKGYTVICQTVESGTATVAELSRETGICANTLYGWMKRYLENREKPFVGSGHILPENEEMVHLRRENKDLREESEILKMAATYFAKHQK
jgi:transposase